MTGNRILVTKSYDDMLHRLLQLRQHDLGDERGVVLTGQPGTGKTMFLKFMLAWLISADQVVILCDSSDAFLFYNGKVYCRPAENGFENLPKHEKMAYCSIWTLIDMDYEERGPYMSSCSNIWPIQATSTNPDQWRAWSKQNGATLLGMPLWNVEELMRGLHLHPMYNKFRSRLEHALTLSNVSTFSTTDEDVIDAALEVLREREKVEAEKNEDEDMAEGTGSEDTTEKTGNKDMVEEAGQSPAPVDTVDNALEILVHNAIEEFGLAPRDVYNGVFKLRSTRRQHANAVGSLNYTELQEAVRFFSQKCGLNSKTSHRVVAVYPRPITPHSENSLGDPDLWEIDFKSIRIAKKAMESMRLLKIERLQEMFGLFHRISQGSTFAGWVFEAIVHRLFSGGWQSTTVPKPIRMDRKGPKDSPVFYIDSPSSPDPSSSTPSPPLRARTRAVTLVNFAPGQLSDVTLEDDRYYIPIAPNDPLFDSFTVDVEGPTSVISIFQMTTSRKHQGSDKGYFNIRKIMARVRQLLMESHPGSTVTVTVAYFLVSLDGESKYQWKMPTSWNKNYTINDHRGECFCIRIPVPEYSGS